MYWESESECDGFGYEVLMCKDNEWQQYDADKQTEANKDAAITAGTATFLIV